MGGKPQTLICHVTLALWMVLATLALSTPAEASQGTHCQKGPAHSYLWRIREHPPAYVFGTVHIANDAIWPSVPSNVKLAWQRSDAVYAELDWSDGDTQAAVRRCRHLAGGRTIDQLLPADVFERLRQFMRKVRNALPAWVQNSEMMSSFLIDWRVQKKQLFKTYVGDWKRKRPIWVLLLVNDLSREKVESSGNTVLDENLLNVAKERGQMTGALETANEQCGPLNGLDESVVIQALNKTLEARLAEDWEYEKNVDVTPSPKMSETNALAVAYNCGQFNNQRLMRKLTGRKRTDHQEGSILKEFDEMVESSLVIGRNIELSKTLSRLLRIHKHQSLFFAMGVAHLVGNNSVVTNLRELGHQAENIPRATKLKTRAPLKPVVGSVVMAPVASGGRPGQQGTGGKVDKSSPVWKSAFSANPKDWASVFTGKLNDIVKSSIRKQPLGLQTAIGMNRVTQAFTTPPTVDENLQFQSSSNNLQTSQFCAMTSLLIATIAFCFL